MFRILPSSQPGTQTHSSHNSSVTHTLRSRKYRRSPRICRSLYGAPRPFTRITFIQLFISMVNSYLIRWALTLVDQGIYSTSQTSQRPPEHLYTCTYIHTGECSTTYETLSSVLSNPTHSSIVTLHALSYHHHSDFHPHFVTTFSLTLLFTRCMNSCMVSDWKDYSPHLRTFPAG